ncbi:MAG: Hpt domain-containing protein [Gemmatimonadaceae bacterium]
MTGGLLDFFTLEASEYVEQLDALVSRASAAPPDADAFARTIRALRGSATMAKVNGVAEVAHGLERLARRVRDGDLAWDASSRGVAIAAIDDAKILIRGVRTWGPAEDARAAERIAELERIAPKRASAEPAKSGAAYLAAAATDAAAGLLEYAEQPGSREGFGDVMGKVRALRGVAALKDLPPLSEVVDAVDAAAKAIELGHEDATAERRRLFRTAARVLLEGGDAIRNGGVPPTDSVAVREFAHASATLSRDAGDGDDVVPIASLFPDDAAGGAVQSASHPPTTSANRFRLEVVSQAEHLRRLVADGRGAADAATRERLSRELRGAVRAIARAAQSFGATEIANVFIAAERNAAALEAHTLDVLDRAAALLSASEVEPSSLTASFGALSAELSTATVAGGAPSAAATTGGPTTGGPTTGGPTTGAALSGAALHGLLASGLDGLAPLATEHLAEPLVGPEDDVIPIDELLFRGRDALARAAALGEELRTADGAPDPQTLAELYDLLQLAAAD